MARMVVVLCLIASCGTNGAVPSPARHEPPVPALATDVASGLLITDVEKPPHRIGVPPELFNRGLPVHWGLYKICVNAQGAVANVTVIRRASTRQGYEFPGADSIDSHWIETVKGWRYRPHQVDGYASPFCYAANLEAPRLVIAAHQMASSSEEPPARLTDIDEPPHRLTLPPPLARSSFVVWGLFNICVGADGKVAKVAIIKPVDDLVNQSWMDAIRTWRYQPPLKDGQPAASCHAERLEARMM